MSIYYNDIVEETMARNQIDAEKAESYIASMNTYLNSIVEGTIDTGHFACWAREYADMKLRRGAFDQHDIRDLATYVKTMFQPHCELDINSRCLSILSEIERTGNLPSQAPIALLDLLAWTALPTYLEARAAWLHSHSDPRTLKLEVCTRLN